MAGIKQIRRTRKPRKNVIKPTPQEQDVWLNDVIDTHLQGIMTPHKGGVFHPSVLSNACDRALWLAYHGRMVETPLPANLQRIFQAGSSLEKRVEQWFYGLNILIAREVPVHFESPPISGRIDFLIRHQEFGIIPIELKSINTTGFGKLTKPKPEHQIQLQLYLNMGNYAQGTVLYENKNDQKIKSFIVKRDEKQWNELLERCFRIQEMIEMPQICTGEMWCNCKHVPFEDAS